MTNELVISRVFAASRELVFQAWSSAEHVKQWFCPETYSVPEAQIEFRVGGTFNVCMQSAQGQRHWTRGKFTEIVANSRLVIDMQAVDDQERALFRAYTVVSFSEERGGSTRLEVKQTYTVFDQAALPMIEGSRPGWAQTLDRLEKEVARIKSAAPAARSVSFGTFCIERTWPASRTQVFKALTDPQAKSQWFGGGPGYTELVRDMDVRPGGSERLHGKWEGGMMSRFEARYYDVIADERVVYSYEMHLDNRKISVSLATFELKSAGTGTRLVMTEQGVFLDGYDDAGSREKGSGFLLDALGKWLTGSLGPQH
jgi:uncharacterized protein YndB with AHSA1/START domain